MCLFKTTSRDFKLSTGSITLLHLPLSGALGYEDDTTGNAYINLRVAGAETKMLFPNTFADPFRSCHVFCTQKFSFETTKINNLTKVIISKVVGSL